MSVIHRPETCSVPMPSRENINRISVQVRGTHVFVEGDPELEAPELWVPNDLAADYRVGPQEGRPGYWEISGEPTTAQRVGTLALRLPSTGDGTRDLEHGLYVKTQAMPGSGKRNILIRRLRALSIVAATDGGNISIEDAHADSLLLAQARKGRIGNTRFGGSATMRRCTARGYGVMATVDDVLVLDRVGSHTDSSGRLDFETVAVTRCVGKRLPTGTLKRDLPDFYELPDGLDDPRAKEILLGEGELPDYVV